jgi:glutaminyl-tRNA synthetase
MKIRSILFILGVTFSQFSLAQQTLPRDELAAIREEKNCDALTAMKEMINPDSLNVLPCCYIEKFAAGMKPLSYLQFQRIGYFNVDRDSTPEKMVFNRTVGLKDTWGKINK